MEKIEFSLVIAQVIIFWISAVMTALQKSAIETEKVGRGQALAKAVEALSKATDAEMEVVSFRTKKYDELASDLAACERKHVKMQNEIDGMRESMKVHQAKVASRVASETKAARRDAAIRAEGSTPEDEFGFPKEPENLDDLIKSGVAKPLFEQVEMPLAPPANHRPGFGQVVKGKV